MPKRRRSADSSDSSGSDERHHRKNRKSKASKKHSKKKEKREHKKRSKEAKVSWFARKIEHACTSVEPHRGAVESAYLVYCKACICVYVCKKLKAASPACRVKHLWSVQVRRDKDASASQSVVEHARQERLRIIAEAEAKEKAQADALAEQVCLLLLSG